MTRLCNPWDYSQRDDYSADEFAQFYHPSPVDCKEMDDMLVHCNKNSVYVLNSSYRYWDFDMIELFGSPAGRALTVNNRTAAEMRPCSRSNNSSPHIANNGSASQNRPLCQQPRLYHPLQNCGFNGTCSTIGSSSGLSLSTSSQSTTTTASNKFVETSDLIRYRNNHPQTHQNHPASYRSNPTTASYSTSSSRTNSKIAKIWKLFDEDRIRAKGTTALGAHNNCSGISGSDIFSRCQSRRKSNTVQSEEKSTKDLYNEAAQLLGIKCTLSDSCRCIDCQSQYFDCDDFDSYSEYSDKSYDPEDNFITNQSYFAADSNVDDEDVNNHQDLSGVIVCQQKDDAISHSSVGVVPDEVKGHVNQKHSPPGANVKFGGDGNSTDDNGNQYSPHDVIHQQNGRAFSAGERCDESEICSKQQILLAMALAGNNLSISSRDYTGAAAGINEAEMNDNLIA